MSWRKTWVMVAAGFSLLLWVALHQDADPTLLAVVSAFGIIILVAPAIEIWEWL